jgi:hypothetical protein
VWFFDGGEMMMMDPAPGSKMFGGSDIARRNRYLHPFTMYYSHVGSSDESIRFSHSHKIITSSFRKDLSTYVGINTNLSVGRNAGIRRRTGTLKKQKNNNSSNPWSDLGRCHKKFLSSYRSATTTTK